MNEPLPAFPFPRTDPLAPPPELLRLQRERAAVKVQLAAGQVAWLVLRHADVRRLMTDPRVSADSSREGFPPIGPSGANPNLRTFPRRDPPEHTEQRRRVAAEFLPDRVEALRPEVRSIANELIDTMLAGPQPADFVESVALALPTRVISAMLGVPYEDRDLFHGFEAAVMSLDPAESARGAREELAYIDGLVRRKSASPGDDLISRLITDEVRTGRMEHDELLRIVRTLLSAGHESTANMTSLSVLSLLLDDGARRAFTSQPEIVPGAVLELLRVHSIFHLFAPRVAAADIEVGDETIRKGEGLILSLIAANYDAEAFPDPAKLDLARDARQQMAFGFGAHHCLGQGLARMELAEVLAAVFTRIPTLRLAVPLEELKFRTDRATWGLQALPVAW